MDPGDILLFHHGRGFNSLIALVQRSPYYHVALSVGGETIVEARPQGVELNDLRTRSGGETFVRIAAQRNAGPAAAQWAQTQVGDGYDAAGVVAMLLDRLFVHLHMNRVIGDRFTCGELVALAYERAGHRLFPDIRAEDVEPHDFARFLK